MKILKLLPLLLILSLYNSNSFAAEDCEDIEMSSSVNIVKKLRCKAGFETSASAASSESTKEKKNGILSKIWQKPEWVKKKSEKKEKKN